MAQALAQRGGGGLSLCLASAGVVKMLSIAAFTLAWTHSIEKTAWQEDWRITRQGMELVHARIKGFGAGMEPPPDARLVGGAGFSGSRSGRRCRKSSSAIPAPPGNGSCAMTAAVRRYRRF
jgi:hypothetical protein